MPRDGFDGIRRLVAIDDRSLEFPVIGIGNDWTRTYYGGPFHLFQLPEDRPAVSLVFVQSRDGNTVADNPSDPAATLTTLRRQYGIDRISAVGGRHAATSLVDAGLVQDIYLTTSAIEAGEPDTPWYAGDRMPSLELIVRKKEDALERPILFEHFALVKSVQPG